MNISFEVFKSLIVRFSTVGLLCLFALISHAHEHSEHFTVTELTNDLEGPWGLAFLPNGDMLVTQKTDSLLRLSSTGERLGEVTGLPKQKVSGQGGMLGIAIDPDFSNNQFVYVCLNMSGDGGHGSEVHRGKLVDNTLVDTKAIFIAQPKSRSGYHFGCRVTFDKQGYLFVSLGDRGSRETAQNVNSHNGKVVRIHSDGSIPTDNPFVGKNGLDDIFSYGHRNVQGMTLNSMTGDVWTHEHGPRGGDEINIVSSGDNYGWPVITYGVNYSGTKITDKTEMPGMRQPLVYWDPSIAPSGMTFYTGDMFPEWKGKLFVGSLKFRHLRMLTLKDEKVTKQAELLADRSERIRDVVQGPDGALYVLIDGSNGKVLKLSK